MTQALRMIRYKQISLEERENIYQLSGTGISLSEVARILNRNKSTISREIRRNKSDTLGYLPDRADNLAKRRKNRGLCKIEKCPELKTYIVSKLSEDKWSPEMIAGRMRMEKRPVLISHEAIYQYIYSSQGRKLKLYQYLMYGRRERQLKFSRRKHYIADNYKIKNRPDNINKRLEFGHFEGDLTFFKGSKKGNFTVMSERLSRRSFLIKNNNKSTANVMIGINKLLGSLPFQTIKSITFDNGGEFRQFGLLTLRGIDIFFCNPGSPYEKGTVERTNAILHKYIPKKSNFNSISDNMITHAQDKLNNLPRKILNFLTPNEAWNNYLKQSVALEC